MKKLLLLALLLISFSATIAQEGYPVPPHNPSRLFYIQHANNHNTFVYDANFLGKTLSDNEPIKIYRINYKKGGIKEELTNMQRKMAYGINFVKTAVNTYEFTLAAYPEKKLFLKVNDEKDPHVTVHINGKNIILRRMFLYCNKLGTGVSAINFYGKDAATKKEVIEKLVLND
jgi:hypothetical protein